MRTAVHHLLHQGHQDIVMITGVEDEADFGFASSRCRREGYVDAMLTAGLADRIDFVSADTYGIEGGAAAMSALMDRPTLPTAVVAEYDELAIGAIRTLRRASIAVPGRMSVVGRRRPRDGVGRRSHDGRPARPGAGRRRRAPAARHPGGPGDGPDRGGPAHPARRAVQHRHALVPAVLVGPGLTAPHSASAGKGQNRPVVAIAAPTMPALFCSTAGTTGVPTLT